MIVVFHHCGLFITSYMEFLFSWVTNLYILYCPTRKYTYQIIFDLYPCTLPGEQSWLHCCWRASRWEPIFRRGGWRLNVLVCIFIATFFNNKTTDDGTGGWTRERGSHRGGEDKGEAMIMSRILPRNIEIIFNQQLMWHIFPLLSTWHLRKRVL